MSPHDQQCWKTVPLSNYGVTSHKLLSKYFKNNSNQNSNFVFRVEVVLLLLHSMLFLLTFLDRQTYGYWVWWPRIYIWRILHVFTCPTNKRKYTPCSVCGICLEGKLFLPWSRASLQGVLQTFCQHWRREENICADECQVLSYAMVVGIAFKLWRRLWRASQSYFYILQFESVKSWSNLLKLLIGFKLDEELC